MNFVEELRCTKGELSFYDVFTLTRAGTAQ